MQRLAGVPLWNAFAALLCMYVCGYVVGALLIRRPDNDSAISLAIVRTVAGLLLTTVGFLLSLVLSLPWFLGPCALVAWAMLRTRARQHFNGPTSSFGSGGMVSPPESSR